MAACAFSGHSLSACRRRRRASSTVASSCAVIGKPSAMASSIFSSARLLCAAELTIRPGSSVATALVICENSRALSDASSVSCALKKMASSSSESCMCDGWLRATLDARVAEHELFSGREKRNFLDEYNSPF
eukprot:scaffold35779_cov69-Phaeocystis_antarctica.AAC.5